MRRMLLIYPFPYTPSLEQCALAGQIHGCSQFLGLTLEELEIRQQMQSMYLINREKEQFGTAVYPNRQAKEGKQRRSAHVQEPLAGILFSHYFEIVLNAPLQAK